MSGIRWTTEEVLEALGVDRVTGPGAGDFSGVSTDTRAVLADSLFVALRGERFDGHHFLSQAAERGATAMVVERIPADAPAGVRYFQVENATHALGKLARFRRRQLHGRVVGIAGSNGKTTTKDLVLATLSARFRVHATEANLNNQVGVPLTLLRTPDDAEVVVVEMGTNEPGEIPLLTRIVEPDLVVITSIGEEHLEKLGSLEGVLDEEITVIDGLRQGGLALIAEEPPALVERVRAALGAGRVRVVGLGADADLRPDGAIEVQPDGSTRWSWQNVAVHLPLPGRHNVRNALFALGVARELGISPADAARALEKVPPPKFRGEWKRIGAMRVLVDCYNANPPSVAAAVDLLASLAADGPRVAVVGTMRELGSQADALHRRAAEEIAAHFGGGLDRVIATGDFARAFAALPGGLGERLVVCEDPLEAYAVAALRGDETLLLKASRGEALERWLPLLERDFNGPRTSPAASDRQLPPTLAE
ncbi:MAG: UDP-N-acetylmuramoyl-tripeptide--D-alanyl-D-alanine ligase [Gemmatimonadota bacterium]|nr:UDP-N-acetylmuramoyl-tripeptide--D-alanyl-D-alanine ligase [Gemmatimonadota bacterium]